MPSHSSAQPYSLTKSYIQYVVYCRLLRMCILRMRQCVATIALRSRHSWILYGGLFAHFSVHGMTRVRCFCVVCMLCISVGWSVYCKYSVRQNAYNSMVNRRVVFFLLLSPYHFTLSFSISHSLFSSFIICVFVYWKNRQPQNTHSIQIKISNFYTFGRVYCLHLSCMCFCIQDFVDVRFIDKIKKNKAATCAPNTLLNQWISLWSNA